MPRKAIIPPPIQDLKGEIREDRLLLTWSVPKQNGISFGGIKRFAVLGHTAQGSTPPCPGCPLSFKEVDEILVANPAPARIEAGRVHYIMRFNPEIRYAFKVITYHKSGGVSNDSNIVRMSTN